MSTAPAPAYVPEPFNPTVYEKLSSDSLDYIVNSTLSNCSISNSTISNCPSIGLSTTGFIYCGGAAVSVTEQEIAYLSGVTSNLQTQLNNKITSNSNATLNSLNTTTTSYFATSSGNVGIGRDSSFYKLDVSTNARIGNFVIETNANNFNYNGFSPNSGLKIFWNSIGSINNNNGRTSFLNCGQGGSGGFDFYSCFVNQKTPVFATCRMGPLVLDGNLSVTDPAATITPTELSYISGVTSNIQNQIDNISGTYTTFSLDDGGTEIILPEGYKNHFIWLQGTSASAGGIKYIFINDWNVGKITYNFSTGATTANVEFVLKNPDNFPMYLINTRTNAVISANLTVAGYSYFQFTLQGTSTRSVLLSKFVSEINGLIQFS